MIDTPSSRLAQRLAVGIPALLIGGALISQYGFGLYPCEMCMWQRYPHYAAIGLGLASYVLGPPRLWVAFAALAILASGLIGGFHAGVEYGWWQGITDCATTGRAEGVSAIDAISAAPMIRCDRAPWDLLGISLAGWNCLISVTGAIAILHLLAKRKSR